MLFLHHSSAPLQERGGHPAHAMGRAAQAHQRAAGGTGCAGRLRCPCMGLLTFSAWPGRDQLGRKHVAYGARCSFWPLMDPQACVCIFVWPCDFSSGGLTDRPPRLRPSRRSPPPTRPRSPSVRCSPIARSTFVPSRQGCCRTACLSLLLHTCCWWQLLAGVPCVYRRRRCQVRQCIRGSPEALLNPSAASFAGYWL